MSIAVFNALVFIVRAMNALIFTKEKYTQVLTHEIQGYGKVSSKAKYSWVFHMRLITLLDRNPD